jgi:hypothetical protein
VVGNRLELLSSPGTFFMFWQFGIGDGFFYYAITEELHVTVFIPELNNRHD